MTQNNITDIEKAARLMGYEVSSPEEGTMGMSMPHAKDSAWVTKGEGGWVWFNPRTNKADLMDVEIEFDLDVMNTMCDLEGNYVSVYYDGDYGVKLIHVKYADHPTKFAARSEAVLSVVSQLYDAKYGKDGE